MARKSQNQPPYRIFICHGSKDKAIAKLMSALVNARGEKFGVEAWLHEEDASPGSLITRDEIRKKLKECKDLISLMSDASRKLGWVLFEMSSASALGVKIVPVMHGIPIRKLPKPFADIKGIELSAFDDNYLKPLVNARAGNGHA